MTTTGPWTPTGQPETRKARTWWIIGGIILLALVLFLAYLMGRGWDAAVATEEAADLSPSTSAVTTASPQGATRPPGVGYKDPNALSEDIQEMVGVSITPVQADSIATQLCSSLDMGATPRQVADEAADATSGLWTDSQARMVSMMMMLEYCPRHAS